MKTYNENLNHISKSLNNVIFLHAYLYFRAKTLRINKERCHNQTFQHKSLAVVNVHLKLMSTCHLSTIFLLFPFILVPISDSVQLSLMVTISQIFPSLTLITFTTTKEYRNHQFSLVNKKVKNVEYFLFLSIL